MQNKTNSYLSLHFCQPHLLQTLNTFAVRGMANYIFRIRWCLVVFFSRGGHAWKGAPSELKWCTVVVFATAAEQVELVVLLTKNDLLPLFAESPSAPPPHVFVYVSSFLFPFIAGEMVERRKIFMGSDQDGWG